MQTKPGLGTVVENGIYYRTEITREIVHVSFQDADHRDYVSVYNLQHGFFLSAFLPCYETEEKKIYDDEIIKRIRGCDDLCLRLTHAVKVERGMRKAETVRNVNMTSLEIVASEEDFRCEYTDKEVVVGFVDREGWLRRSVYQLWANSFSSAFTGDMGERNLYVPDDGETIEKIQRCDAVCLALATAVKKEMAIAEQPKKQIVIARNQMQYHHYITVSGIEPGQATYYRNHAQIMGIDIAGYEYVVIGLPDDAWRGLDLIHTKATILARGFGVRFHVDAANQEVKTIWELIPQPHPALLDFIRLYRSYLRGD